MTYIEEIAGRLQHIYEDGGPGAKAQDALSNAETAFTTAGNMLAQVGKGSEQSEIPDSTGACDRALNALREATAALTSALGGVAVYRARVLGEISGGPRTDLEAANAGTSELSTFKPPAAQPKTPRDTQVNFFYRDENGRICKGHLDDNIGGQIIAHTEKMTENAVRFQDFIDRTPNLNARYENEIAAAKTYLESRGLTVKPIAVLDNQSFITASRYTESGENPEVLGGFAYYDRIVVKEPQSELAGQGVTGVIIHEGSHAAVVFDPKICTTEAENEQGEVSIEVSTPSGFHKHRVGGSDAGTYVEEGYSDWTRVSGLTELGQEPRYDGVAITKTGCTYVGEGHETPLPSLSSTEVIIPARFAMAAESSDSEGNGGSLIPAPSGVAAYGLELLNKEAPGLREAMDASRSDPRKQTTVIKLVNSVQPGLYQKLNKLGGSFEDAKQGLRLIGQAIRDRHSR